MLPDTRLTSPVQSKVRQVTIGLQSVIQYKEIHPKCDPDIKICTSQVEGSFSTI